MSNSRKVSDLVFLFQKAETIDSCDGNVCESHYIYDEYLERNIHTNNKNLKISLGTETLTEVDSEETDSDEDNSLFSHSLGTETLTKTDREETDSDDDDTEKQIYDQIRMGTETYTFTKSEDTDTDQDSDPVDKEEESNSFNEVFEY